MTDSRNCISVHLRILASAAQTALSRVFWRTDWRSSSVAEKACTCTW